LKGLYDYITVEGIALERNTPMTPEQFKQFEQRLAEAGKIRGSGDGRVTDLCRLFSVSRPTIYKWQKDGTTPVVDLAASAVLAGLEGQSTTMELQH
jgi:hypothetical protein